jgi:thiopurine S-methyltransferase
MMNDDFWLQAWRDGNIGFNQAHASASLLKHWPVLQLAKGTQVFVPLAGKSIDMAWLAGQGHRVLGVELSPLAVAQFFDERKLRPEQHASRWGTRHVAGAFELICGNVFGLDPVVLADCAAVYDRAAIVAQPPDQRQRYLAQVYGALPNRCVGLMLAMEYPQREMQGPPFSVDEAEVRRHLEPVWQVDLLERNDILAEEPHFADRGLTRLSSAAYRLVRGVK